jgi:hypothetical protein
MSPTIVNVFEPVQTIEDAEYCARNLGAEAVAAVEVIVTPAPCENVT